MFELLLQADKALADGSLDQAERTYWQLIELDSQNAIAVAGLARVAMERGDEKKAREFADRALGIDPDSIAARRIIDTLAHGGPKLVADPIAQQMLGAERLEALSHRRAAEAGDSRE
jgi:tetratricopeptide (TPR) repeat protein